MSRPAWNIFQVLGEALTNSQQRLMKVYDTHPGSPRDSGHSYIAHPMVTRFSLCLLLPFSICLSYCPQNPSPNAYTLAIRGKRPFIVLHTSLVDLMEPEVGTFNHSHPFPSRNSFYPYRRCPAIVSCENATEFILLDPFTLQVSSGPKSRALYKFRLETS